MMPRKKPAQPAVDPITDRWTEEAKVRSELERRRAAIRSHDTPAQAAWRKKKTRG